MDVKNGIYKDTLLSDLHNTEVLKKQYKNADNLNTRISIHDKYSINKMGFGNWIVSQYEIMPDTKVLELGCGTGSTWLGHMEKIEKCSKVILTDFSAGMLKSTHQNLGDSENLEYQVVDIQNIPFADESFDIVIANMMLYHVPDLNKGLWEVKRVLKPKGKFYCATYGEHGIVEYIENLLAEYGIKGKLNKSFTLQNGGQALSCHFKYIEKIEYKDSLAVTDINDLLDYIYSLSSMTNIKNIERNVVRKILEAKKVDGIVIIPKEYGMFICKK